jgi:hypothetical protein
MMTNRIFVEGEFLGVYPIEKISADRERRYLGIKAFGDQTVVLELLKTKTTNCINIASTFEIGEFVTCFFDITQYKARNDMWVTSLNCYRIDPALPPINENEKL